MNLKEAFTGIRVLAVTHVVSAPFAAYQLAMHGADVITIEKSVDGDSQRRAGDPGTPFRSLGMGRTFLAFNSNKRSLALAIDTLEGQDVFRRMAAQADVVMENLKGGTMARYGLGYADIQKINPGIIFCSITGYGQTGPKKSDAGIDGAIQAVSGMMSITGTEQSGPLKTGSTVVDYATGYAAALAVAIALFQRSRTGQGQEIDVSMLETALTLMSGEAVRAITGGGTPPLVGNASGKGSYVADTYRCKDGHIAIAAGAPARRAKVWGAIGREDIPLNPLFSSDEATRSNMNALNAEITRTLSTKTAREWEVILNRAGVAAAAVLPLHEAVQHPQLQARNFFHHFEGDPASGLPAYDVPTASYRMSASPAKLRSPPPGHGQHSDEVLAEFGFSKEEVDELRANRII